MSERPESREGLTPGDPLGEGRDDDEPTPPEQAPPRAPRERPEAPGADAPGAERADAPSAERAEGSREEAAKPPAGERPAAAPRTRADAPAGAGPDTGPERAKAPAGEPPAAAPRARGDAPAGAGPDTPGPERPKAPRAEGPAAPRRQRADEPAERGPEAPARERPATDRAAATVPIGDRPGAPLRAPGYGPGSPAPPGAGGTAPAWGGRPALAGQYELSGWWRRAGALVIDSIIIGIGALILLLIFGGVFSVGFFAGDTAGAIAVVVGLLLATISIAIVALLYAPWLMARTNGQTLGRMATGIRVVRAGGEPMTFGFAMVREVLIKALLFGFLGSLTFGIVQLADFLWPLWDEENRALHDMIVDTRVVRS